MSYEWLYPNRVHLRSGWNRFFGFIDLNQNGEFDAAEPAGLSVSHPMLISSNAVNVDIALTDYLVGSPRIFWSAPETNILYNVLDHYTVTISAGGSPVATVDVKKPRTFLHEGDLVVADHNGLEFGAATQVVFDYTVTHGDDIISSGVFSYDLGTDADRKTMEIQYPTTNDVITVGSDVEFRWKMDYRNEGSRISITGLDDEITYYDQLINFPVRHGRITDDWFYYSAVPQNVDGKEYFTLPPGSYNYTIKEYIRTTSGDLTKQQITGTFEVVAEE